MIKTFLSFIFLCFTTYHSLLLMERKFGEFEFFKKDGDIANSIYPTEIYQDSKGNYIVAHKNFPQTLTTEYFFYEKNPNNRSFLNTFLNNIIAKDKSLLTYFEGPILNTGTHHQYSITCNNNNNYICFSLESRLFATYNKPLEKYDDYIVNLSHFDIDFKQKDISLGPHFGLNAVFFADKYLIIGSHHLEDYKSPKKIKNKYHIDIFDTTEFANNKTVLPDVLNSNLKYHISIDVEDKDTSIDLTMDQSPYFSLKTAINTTLFLHNNLTKKHTEINFLNNTKRKENINSMSIDYDSSKPKGHKIFSVLEESVLKPFQYFSQENNGMISTITYTNDQGFYVKIQQTFPVILTTNFFIKSEEKTLQQINNYTPQERQDYINVNMDPDRLITVVNKKMLRLFINSLLDYADDNQKEPDLHYTVKHNSDQHNETIILCEGESKGLRAFHVPPHKRYRCFSLESRLLAIYSTVFSRSCPKPYDKRHEIILQHLDNREKKHIIKTNSNLTIQSIFLEGPYLIVGSHHSQYSDNKHQYYIDIYDATEFAKNTDSILPSEGKNSAVSYFLGIDIEIDESRSADMQESIKNKIVPCTLCTVNKDECILVIEQSESENTYVNIPYLNVNMQIPEINVDEYKVIYRNAPIPEPKNLISNNYSSYRWKIFQELIKENYGYIGIVGAIVLIILLHNYHTT